MNRLKHVIGLLALILSLTTFATDLQKQEVVMDDGHRLMLYSKAAEQPWASILLVHGRTWSALPDFDLVTEQEDLSMMNALAAKGLAVYAIDLRGYGKSKRDSSGWNTPNRAAEDVAMTLDVINDKHPNLSGVTVFGWSNGSLVAMLTAQLYPNKVERLVLYGFPLDTEAEVAREKAPKHPPRLATTAAAAAEDFILPGTISKNAIAAYVQAALEADPIRTDWRALEQWDQLDGAKLTRPTLLLQAESDPYMNLNADAELFKKIAAKDKQWVILGNADHAALLETSRFRLYHAVVSFMQSPN
ncbi:alpha/beta fold hydrolase [Simiduia litorea]